MYSTPGTVPYSRKSSENGETSGFSKSESMLAYLSVRRSTLRSATCIYHPLPQPWWCQSSFALRQRHRILWRTPKLRHKNGRRPTLPRSLPRSTIGAGGLNFSVRNGKRCIPAAIVTLSRRRQVFCCKARLTFENRIARALKEPSSPRLISTTRLHTLLHLHLWPIN